MNSRNRFLSVMLRLVLMAVFVFGLMPVSDRPSTAVAASDLLASPQLPASPNALTNRIRLGVVSARTEPKFGAPLGDPNPPGILKGDPVTQYKFILNLDNVGDPTQPRYPDCAPYVDPAHTITNTVYPALCDWPGVRSFPGYSPIITQGDQDDFNGVISDSLALPPGKYIVSVWADGFKIDGQWFTIPVEESVPGSGIGVVNVETQPLPLPTATIRIKVFEDNAIVNGAPDVPVENGLAGFEAHVAEWLGEVTTDVFGNPICTQYETDPVTGEYVYVDGAPVPIVGTGGRCVSDINGDIVIPNLGPNRWAVSVVKPSGSNWIQTTTLEGNLDWDTWVQEGATGYDTEFVIAGEPFPFTIFGFVQPTFLTGHPDMPVTGGPQYTGEIKGVVMNAKVYVPYNGGLPYQGHLWGGLSGVKLDAPIAFPYVSLTDLQRGDVAVYVGQGDANGAFDIKGVPDGNYTLTYWSDQMMHILDLFQISIVNGEVSDVGNIFLTSWFSQVEGYVFADANGNGKMDPSEHGIEGYPVVLKRRENSVMDRGSVGVLTDPNGYYVFEAAYPLTQWLVLESYTDSYYVTGFTYQTDNQPTKTTVVGAGVDVGYLPIIGQSGRIDWGVQAYAPGTNGGIVGTVTYDTTRNEHDPKFAAFEPWQPGIPGLTVNLYDVVRDVNGRILTETTPGPNFGAYLKGRLLNTAVTETWERPKNCQARDVDGNPIDQYALPPATGDYDCLESPQSGLQFQSGYATVDGNYGFGSIAFDINGDPIPEDLQPPLPAGDYLVEIAVPTDTVLGRPLYGVTREEDINVFNGDSYFPQAPGSPDVPPPACAGPLHTVDVAGIAPGGVLTTTFDSPNAVINPTFVEMGGSEFEGMPRNLCDMKLVTLNNQKSVAPTLNFFTEVPIPGKYLGYIVDDLNISTDPQDMLFGEKKGIALSPIGIYDYSNRLVTTILSDPHGIFEVLLPSTETISCPTPSGVCPNLYRIVGNDPGQPGRINPQYNPQFRTIAAIFEVFPGVIIPADLAPTQIGVSIQGPGSQFNAAVSCQLDSLTPQLFAVSPAPYVYRATGGQITIDGLNFGSVQGRVTVGPVNLPIVSWTDRRIVVSIPPNVLPGAQRLNVNTANQKNMINGVTFHVLGGSYMPTLFEVGPGKPYATIQAALEDAHDIAPSGGLVVVYPGTPGAFNPKGVYFANVIMHSPVKLQGVGPGGVYTDTSVLVPGSVISGLGWGGDTDAATAWRQLMASLNWVGDQAIYEGPVVTVLAESATQYRSAFQASVDGFSIEGGNQFGFPGNLNEIWGIPNDQQLNVEVQGGGIYVNGYIRYFRVTNNILQSNGGTYGGAIRVGTPNLPPADGSLHNENMAIQYNQIIANGGANLAGAVGIFRGADNYNIGWNDICGNFSAEYGGGISVYGYSPNGLITNNRIYFNRSYDEGGGIMIAGELPADPTTLSAGTGSVQILNNIIQANLSNDDGGGIRFLMSGAYLHQINNNMIVNNVSTHEGGGISFNDTPNVRFINNTVMKNITTATALTSNGQPAPAGLSTSANSLLLQATLPPGAPTYSRPFMFNNIFWDNRAGSWNGDGISGIGLQGDPNPINYWDLGVADYSGTLYPHYSILQLAGQPTVVDDGTNIIGLDPLVKSSYDVSVTALPWRTNPRLVGVIMVAVDLPPTLMGNYHLESTSPAVNAGVAFFSGITAPRSDIDGDLRIGSVFYDIGADELGPRGGFLLVIPGSLDMFEPIQIFLPILVK